MMEFLPDLKLFIGMKDTEDSCNIKQRESHD